MNSERLMICLKKRRIVSSFLLIVQLFLFASEANAARQSLNCPVYSVVETDQRLIALTFDDGPHSEKTPVILDILRDNNVSATFFIVGENAKNNEDIIERIIDEGHEIGNHTYGHKYLFGNDKSDMEREIDLCDDEIFNHSEYNTRLFRPPGGIYNDLLISVCAQRGYSLVLWSIDTRDWEGRSADEIEREVMNNIQNGAIILMHDYVSCESHTGDALKRIIPKLKELGYRFVTVSELIGD